MLEVRLAQLVIPTYERGADDPRPSLTFGGARHGRRRPFPYAMQDDIDIATMRFDPERRYRAVVLSNGLLEATILPEMNGRLYSLRDLQSGREVFYRNRVVKPALVALRGAWISGGVEFNFPTLGHTVSTVSPVASGTEQQDNEVAVWVGDLDRATGQRWRARLSLKEGRAALDTRIELSNPNLWRERLYYWENAAVPAAQDLRFVCRCDWTVGAESRPFPLREGRDVSMHVHNPSPCDHFGYRSHADFFGAHYASRRCGTYHVAPRIEAPGQKYFTWGTREDNKIWEKYLTDADGQYVEIQSGILETQWFTGWLDPLQTICTQGSWFGVADCPELTWANARMGVAVERHDSHLAFCLHSIDVDEEIQVVERRGEETSESTARLRPGQAVELPSAAAGPVTVQIRDRAGRLLLSETWNDADSRGLPADRPAEPPVQWGMHARSQPAVRVAETEVKYHRWQTAREALAKHADAIPEQDAMRVQAEIALKTGAWKQARELAQTVARNDPEDHPAHAIAMAAALGCLREGDRRSYYAVCDHALVIRNDARYAPAASLAVGEASLLTGRPMDAVAALERAAFLAPTVRQPAWLLSAARLACGENVDPGELVRQRLRECELSRPLANEAFLELVLTWWRAGCTSCVAQALPLAPEPNHPAVRLLAGLPPSDHQPVGTLLARPEEAALLRQALGNTEAAPLWTYLLAIWELENDRGEQALARLTRLAEAPSEVRWLAHAVLADHAANVAREPANAVRHLEAALAGRGEDHRLLCMLDDLLRELQDVPHRRERWATASPALRRRGDVVFRLARLALDEGRGAKAATMLLAQQFSVYEGGTDVRRLYVDARLVAAMQALAEADLGAGAAHCEAVLAYPENLGAASYLGEHSRLARYLLGLIALRSGNATRAQDWWQDVLERSGGAVSYTVGGEDTARNLREDERLAVWLSARRLDGEHSDQQVTIPDAPRHPDDACAALSACIRARTRRPEWEEAALAMSPCSPLVRILVGLAALEE